MSNQPRSHADDADPDASPAESYLAPAPHELGANLIFTDEGLTPYFALDRARARRSSRT
jgi:hypothetical protein